MAIEDRLLNRLLAEQQRFALDALKRPSSRDAFEYGFLAGKTAGYQAAIDALQDEVRKERDDDRDL